MKNDELKNKFHEQAQKVCDELGFILYDVEYNAHSKTLCIFIMNEETKTAVIDDCIKVDNAFSDFMEQNSWVPDEIILEVSSPGIFRHLTTADHFKWGVGEIASVTLNKNLGELYPEMFDLKTNKIAKNKKFLATIEDASSDDVTIKLEKNELVKIKYNDIKKANLEPQGI